MDNIKTTRHAYANAIHEYQQFNTHQDTSVKTIEKLLIEFEHKKCAVNLVEKDDWDLNTLKVPKQQFQQLTPPSKVRRLSGIFNFRKSDPTHKQ